MLFIVIGIIFSLVALIGLMGARKSKKRNFSAIEVVIPVFIFIGFIIAGSIKTVGAGEVGIMFSPFNGGIQKVTLSEGWHFTLPVNKVYKIETTQQQLKLETFSVQTQDSEYADFIVEIKYRIPRQNAYKVYNEYRGMPTTANIQVDVQSSIKEFTTNYNIYDILGKGYEQLRKQAFDDLQQKLEVSGIQLIELNFIDIDAGAQIEQAIVDKGIIKQKKEQAEQEKLVAEIEQQTKIIQAETAKQEQVKGAEADAEQKKIAAEAEAERILLEAQAQAEAMRLILEQLNGNPDYIEYIKWSNWDGKLPDVLAGDSSSIIVDSRTNTEPTN